MSFAEFLDPPPKGPVSELAAQVADRVAELLRADIVASDDLIFNTKAAARICGLSPRTLEQDAVDGAGTRLHHAHRNFGRLSARRIAGVAAVPSALWPPRPGVGSGRRSDRISNRRRLAWPATRGVFPRKSKSDNGQREYSFSSHRAAAPAAISMKEIALVWLPLSNT
jgi:hypothetical protein